jgi:hypothetical protein
VRGLKHDEPLKINLRTVSPPGLDNETDISR